MNQSSIDSIKEGETVYYKGNHCIVKKNTGENVLLKNVDTGITYNVPFYECNLIQNEEGVYF